MNSEPTKLQQNCCQCNMPTKLLQQQNSQLLCQQCIDFQKCKYEEHASNEYKLYPQIDKIEQKLYLGNEDASLSQKVIQKNQISAIFICGSYLIAPFEKKKMNGQFQDIKYKRYRIGDYLQQAIMDKFDESYQWIDQCISEGRNVLVHCAAGISRSASFVIAYLMKKNKWSFNKAYKFVKKRRQVSPNEGFKKQLMEYEKIIKSGKQGQKFIQ